METGPREGEPGQARDRQGPWTAGGERGGGSERHRSPVLLSRRTRPEERRRQAWHQGQDRGSRPQRGRARGVRNRTLPTAQGWAQVGSYLQAVLSLAQREGLQGTGEGRRAAGRRRQQQGQQQAIELPAAAGAGIWGAAQDLALLDPHDQGEHQVVQSLKRTRSAPRDVAKPTRALSGSAHPTSGGSPAHGSARLH